MQLIMRTTAITGDGPRLSCGVVWCGGGALLAGLAGTVDGSRQGSMCATWCWGACNRMSECCQGQWRRAGGIWA